MISLNDFVRRELHHDLITIHRSGALSLKRNENGIVVYDFNNKILDRLAIDPVFSRVLRISRDERFTSLINLWIATSDALANGPKVVQPSLEDCQLLRNVMLTIPFSQYQQPYPSVIVEWPEAFRCQLQAEMGVSCFRANLLHRSPTGLVIASATKSAHDSNNITGSMNGGLVRYDTIEDFFVFNADEEHRRVGRLRGENIRETFPENERINKLNEAMGTLTPEYDFHCTLKNVTDRVAMNLMMCLVYQGWATLRQPNRQRVRTLQRRARHGDRDAAVDLANEVVYIGLQQTIKIADAPEGDLHEDDIPTCKRGSPHPHWRRGHEHTYHVGPRALGRTEKRVIEPIMVRSRFFLGDLSTTGVSYQTAMAKGK